MKYTIRECDIKDAEHIYKLNVEEMGYEYPLEKTKENMAKFLNSDNDKIFVAEVESVVVGYIHATDYNLIYAPNKKNIMGIAVASEYKKMGIGKALLKEVEEWAKKTGAVEIRLVSGERRVDAHSFYEKCGYIKDSQKVSFNKNV